VYAAVAVHSGLSYGVASDVASAFKAMKHGGGAHAHADAGSTPLMVVHGDGDPTVDAVNAECLVAGRLRSSGADSTGYRKLTTTGQVPRGRHYTRTAFSDKLAIPIIEQWTVHQGGHAWAGGSPRGSYTDPLGPDASAEIVRFFQHHVHAAVGRRRQRRQPADRRALGQGD
jgi:poly(3-hydroxybutyrate) depolymerase